MDAQYHIQLLTESVGTNFSAQALEEIIAGNLGQDSLRYLLGTHPHFHFDDNQIAKGLAYVEEEQTLIRSLGRPIANGEARAHDIPDAHIGAMQRAAFGRLTHAIHDFYAHSNYVDLWLAEHGGLANSHADEIDGLDANLLNSPQLYTCSFWLWFDTFYLIPGFGPFLHKLYLRPHSHEAMNLDNPGRGPKFAYAMVAAKQRTIDEYDRVVDGLYAQGGEPAVSRFQQG